MDVSMDKSMTNELSTVTIIISLNNFPMEWKCCTRTIYRDSVDHQRRKKFSRFQKPNEMSLWSESCLADFLPIVGRLFANWQPINDRFSSSNRSFSQVIPAIDRLKRCSHGSSRPRDFPPFFIAHRIHCHFTFYKN